MKRALLLLPAFGTLGLLFFGGLGFGLLQSLGFLPLVGEVRPGLGAYLQVITRPGFAASFGFTTLVSLMSTVLTILFALFTAFSLRTMAARGRGTASVRFLYQIPITVPHLVVAVGVLALLGQSGLFARMMYHIGLISEPAGFPALVNDRFGIGIIVVYVWKQVPFIGLIALSVLQTVGEDYEAVARTLGAGRWQTLWHVLLPTVIPAILPASIIVFAYTFGAFEVPLLLGQRFPAMLSVEAYRLYTDTDFALRPQAMALMVLITLAVLLLSLLYQRLALRGKQ